MLPFLFLLLLIAAVLGYLLWNRVPRERRGVRNVDGLMGVYALQTDVSASGSLRVTRGKMERGIRSLQHMHVRLVSAEVQHALETNPQLCAHLDALVAQHPNFEALNLRGGTLTAMFRAGFLFNARQYEAQRDALAVLRDSFEAALR